jgi:hypothetical protein
VAAADTVFPPGSVAQLVAGASPAGAIAVRRGPGSVPVRVADGLVEQVVDAGGEGPFSAAPLWVAGPPVHERLCLDARPWELGRAFQAAVDAGEQIAAVEIGPTRDLTTPADLLERNFPYLGGL